MVAARLSDLEIINAKHRTSYPPGTPLWYGITEMDRDVADAATNKTQAIIDKLVRALEHIRDYKGSVIGMDIYGFSLVKEEVYMERDEPSLHQSKLAEQALASNNLKSN
jgi:hypothetical protein|tara:strand:+ start:16930 stop:17256 length:327 start_codon:yes stop_codon:yes gene_type:complete